MFGNTTKAILLSTTMLALTACGGGGGGGSVTLNPDAPTDTSFGTTVSSSINAIDNGLQVMNGSTGMNISAVQQIQNPDDLKTVIDSFKGIEELKTTWDGLDSDDKQILNQLFTVTFSWSNGKNAQRTVGLEKAIDIAYGMYKRYYEPHKTFWDNAVTTGEFDDTDSNFTALKTKVDTDWDKDANSLIDTFDEEVDGTAPTVIKEEFNTVTYTEDSKVTITTDGTRAKDIYYETVEEDGNTYTVGYQVTETYDSWRVDTITYSRTDTIKTYSNGKVETYTGQPSATNTVTGAVQELVTAVSDPVEVSREQVNTDEGTDNGSESETGDTGSTEDDSTDTGTGDSEDTGDTNTGENDNGSSEDGSNGDSGSSDDSESTDNSESDSSDTSETTNTPYTDTDSNLGTKTTGLSTNPDDFLTQEFYYGYSATTGTSYSQNLVDIGANYAWSRGWTGEGSKVGIIDSGINMDHQEFTDSIAGTKDFTGMGIEDAHGHGSHVAGTIGANRDGNGMVGVAFDSDLYIAKNTHSGYGGGYWEVALDWLESNDVDVVNISQNYNYDYRISTSGGTAYTLIDADKGIYKLNDTYIRNNVESATPNSWLTSGYGNAVDQASTWGTYLAGNEMVIVNSAGNQGLPFAAQPGSLAPEVDENGNLKLDGRMIVVGAYNAGTGSNFGNKAGTICYNVVGDVCQDQYTVSDFFIRAPGVAYSASAGDSDSYTWMSGTSMAAPMVTGSIAVIHQMWPHMKGEHLVDLLLTTADDTYDGYSVANDGHGRLDLNAATLPVGATGIPTDGRTTGTTISSSGYTAGSSTMPSSISALIVETESVYNREWLIPVAEASVLVDTAFHDFKSYGNMKSAGTQDFAIHTDDTNNNMAVTYDGTTIGMLNEEGQYLGQYFDGMFDIGTTQTLFIQKQNKFMLENQTTMLTANFSMGYTDVNTTSNSMITSSDDLLSVGWNVGATNKITDTWSINSYVAQPVRVIDGSMNVTAPTSRSGDTVNYTTTEWNQSGITETDVGLGASYMNGNFSATMGVEQRFNTATGDQFSANAGIKWVF